MAQTTTPVLQAPYSNPLTNSEGFLSSAWQLFIRKVVEIIEPFGEEQSFGLANNVSVAVAITGLSFNSEKISQVIVDYIIQRVTTTPSATELIQSGSFILVYRPTSLSWSLVAVGTPGPDVSGVTFSVSSFGQVKYTSTNITGVPFISKITWRTRSLQAKNSKYSTAGR